MLLLRFKATKVRRKRKNSRRFCSSDESAPMKHAQIINLMREMGVIKSDSVFKACLHIKPSYFAHLSRSQELDEHHRVDAEQVAEVYHTYITTLESLRKNLYPGGRALDIGSGSGFITALMAHMVGDSGLVVGVDNDENMIRASRINMMKAYPELYKIIRFEHEEGFNGFKQSCPYDVIHVGGAVKYITSNWIRQLKIGGLMTAAIIQKNGKDQMLCLFTKYAENLLSTSELFPVCYEPLLKVYE
eukprot:TRINITY_DN10870_c0_g1_i1.p1 TRINITY_DN10870_c0_g1~~TRINITY_DN10870_c0_g1_i1.p1  ORF type:complete len:245 (-),score=25.23 TRINITY_DN10870_c0_g1_i1:4-738(-)